MNSLTFANHSIFWEVSPCSWMYPGYGLQVRISLKANAVNAECEFVHNKTVRADTLPKDQLREAAEHEVRQWLEQHGVKPLQTAVTKWARYAAKFKREESIRQARSKQQLAAADAKHKAQGFTHRVDAWIHPRAGGDDYPVRLYTRQSPTAAELRKLLQPSAIKTDYRVTPL